MSDVMIGVDLGGTRIRTAQFDTQFEMIRREETLTKADEGLEPTIERIKAQIASILPEDRSTVRGIGICAPGPTNPETGVVVHPPNLPGWIDVPLGEILRETFDLPVYVGNDANVAALAEAAVGAAQGYKYAIYITISTGIGSGIIYDGRLVLGKQGLGAEIGHIPLVLENGTVSTLEKEAAGPALARKAQERLKRGAESILLERSQGDLEKIDAKMIGDAVHEGDRLALEIIHRAGMVIGLGVVTMLHIFNPEIIVIGGGVSYVGDPLFDRINETVRKYSLDDEYWKDLQIIPSEISENVSLIGSATLVATEGGSKDLQHVLKMIGLV